MCFRTKFEWWLVIRKGVLDDYVDDAGDGVQADEKAWANKKSHHADDKYESVWVCGHCRLCKNCISGMEETSMVDVFPKVVV